MSLRKSFFSRKFSKSFRELSVERSGRVRDAEDGAVGSGAAQPEGSWAGMLPELLAEIIRRVESSDGEWPLRQNVVACACVCKRWRQITKEIVRPPSLSGIITFPSCLKQVFFGTMRYYCYLLFRTWEFWLAEIGSFW
jgi:tubby-related protein 1